MSAFEVELNVIGTNLGVPSKEAQKAGVSNLEVILNVAMTLPFAQQGQGPMMAHIGNVKYKMDRDSAIDFFKTALEAAEDLPAPSKLAIATDLNAATKAADAVAAMRDGNGSK